MPFVNASNQAPLQITFFFSALNVIEVMAVHFANHYFYGFNGQYWSSPCFSCPVEKWCSSRWKGYFRPSWKVESVWPAWLLVCRNDLLTINIKKKITKVLKLLTKTLLCKIHQTHTVASKGMKLSRVLRP